MEENHSRQAVSQSKTDTLGIISIVLAFVGLQLIGFILGLVGASAAKKEGRSPKLSRIGWILNLVFGILFVLMMIIIFAAVPFLQKNSRDTVRKNDLSVISSELSSFYSNNRYYPASLDELGSGVVSNDPEGRPYTYTPSPAGCTQCEAYELQTTLETSEPSTYTLSSE